MKGAIRAGLLELAHLARARRPRALVVLLYHRVLPSPPPGDPYAVSVAMFGRHLDALDESGRRDVALDGVERLVGARDGLRVLIVFDDGYQSALDFAVPLLRERGRKAGFFLVPGAMGATSEWERPFGLSPSPLMTWEGARRLLAAGMSVGSHSTTHPDLSATDDASIEVEVRGSRGLIESALGVRVAAFSVPFGRDDGRIDRHLRDAGYSCKLTNPFAASRPGPIRAFAVSGVRQDDGMRGFHWHLSGAYDAVYGYHRLRRRLLGDDRR